MAGRQDSEEIPGYEEFVGYLRSGLHYLYDPVHLRRSPLVSLLGLGAAFDRAGALQKLLIETIQKMKPAEDEPPQSPAWQIYDTLSLQYIRQFPRSTVANQLGISERQLRREQRLALEALAQRLWESLGRRPASADLPGAGEDQTLSEELGWLETSTDQRAPLGEVLQTVVMLAEPLAQKHQVCLRLTVAPEIAMTLVREQAMRHTLLTILSEAISTAEPGEVKITTARLEGEIHIRVAFLRSAAKGNGENRFDTARKLAAFYGAMLRLEGQDERQSVALAFQSPFTAAGQVPVLVVDDNADWLEMLKRFAAGTKFQITGTRDPEAALGLAKAIQPAVIFLDVMMPGSDGWQILHSLRRDQSTSATPIVACTVLPLQDLALSLGVNAFLQKPVTQGQFLNMVEKLSAPGPVSAGAPGLA